MGHFPVEYFVDPAVLDPDPDRTLMPIAVTLILLSHHPSSALTVPGLTAKDVPVGGNRALPQPIGGVGRSSGLVTTNRFANAEIVVTSSRDQLARPAGSENPLSERSRDPPIARM
jgi:hypothetical protein